MKRNLVFVLLLTLFGTGASAQLKVGKLLKAGGNLISAVTLTDADIAEMSKSAVEKMDQENQVDTSDYHRRLQRLTENISVDGLKLNFKVYLTKDINAFACGDGSVRVYSALMDTMSDSELMAIIGHEIGHVARTDTKDALKNAYLRSAAQNAAGFGQRQRRRQTVRIAIGRVGELAGAGPVFAEAGIRRRRVRIRVLPEK